MGRDDDKGDVLREDLERALDKNRPKDVIAALQGLESLEPREPRWPQRLGDALQRSGKTKDAEAAYLRALDILVKQGYLPRAVALANLIVSLNPSRSDILNRLQQDAAKSLRTPKLPSLPSTQTSCPPAPILAPEIPGHAVSTTRPLSVFPGAKPPTVVSNAKLLQPAATATDDEVLFEDLDDEDLIEVDVNDMEVISIEDNAPADNAHRSAEEHYAAWVSRMSATTLFADISKHALTELAAASVRVPLRDGDFVVRKGALADALYVIVEGCVRVILPALPSGGIDLAEGQIFGEACLFDHATRQADVCAKGDLLLLRIPMTDLHRITHDHPELNDVLFGLLAGRLIANLLQTSSLFMGFDLEQRREIARMFEVRRAAPDTLLQQEGKASDALYVSLLGDIEMEKDGLIAPLPPGSVFGHESIVNRAPADRTLRVASESIVLRMPYKRFVAFAAHYPTSLEHLSELASSPPPMWPSS